jgi:hypothetical protein
MRRIIITTLIIAFSQAVGRDACPQVVTRADSQGQIDSRHTTFNISALNGLPVAGRTNAQLGLDYDALVNVSVEHKIFTMHRLIVDRTRHLYYGYDLIALPADEPARVSLHFAPLSGLESFKGVPFDSLSPGAVRRPLADRIADLGVPVILPLIVANDGTTVLADELRFGS